MKKLLGILGTITITGGGMPVIVGNVPTSAKNEVNYQQKNNLESLNRIKRTIEEIMKIIWTDDWHISALAVE
ncbi:hypothetical protein [Spiroplasma endosymbiont of Agriotes lineatus]|uniref:hypothetical protein n=1 Tax=Spiroplasma endosymbiont of Agriotes lineatus TaxID=3077930 RepID=UPI0030CEE835